MAGFGGAVKLTGESEYKRALREITQNLKEVGSQMKLTASMYDRNDKSTAALTAKDKDLNKVLSQQEKKVHTLTAQYHSLSGKNQENINKHLDLSRKLKDAKAKLEEIGKASGVTSEKYKEQEEIVNKLERDYKKSSAAVDANKKRMSDARAELNRTKAEFNNTSREIEKNKIALKDSKSAYSQLTDTISKQENKLKELKREYANTILESGKNSKASKDLKSQINGLNGELDKNKKKLHDVEKELDNTQMSSKKAVEGFTVLKGALSNFVSSGLQRITSGIKTLSNNIVNIGIDFDSAMSKVSAVSGATGNDLLKLRDKAKEMGAATKFTATESAQAFNYMAMAGWKTEDMLNGIEGIMNLAAAAGADLAITSDIVTDALTAFGKSAKDSGQLADIMAAASSNANTNVEMMGETFKYVAPVAGALGYSMEDTAVAIGLMANSGVKASQAGTALRSILSRLAAPPKSCAVAMSKLGISITRSDGTMRSLGEVMEMLRSKFQGLSKEQQTQYAHDIAGQYAMSGLLAIVNAAPNDYEKLTKAVQKSNGVAKSMADTMNNNLGGKLTLFKSKLEGIALTIFERLEPSLSGALKSTEKFVGSIDWKSFGKTVGDALNSALKGFKWLIDNKQVVVNALKLMLTGFAVKHMNDWTKSINEACKRLVTFIGNSKKFVLTTYRETAAQNAATASTKLGTIAQTAHNVVSTAGTTVTKGLAAAQQALNVAFKANPIGFVISGITTAISVFSMFTSTTDETSEAQSRLNEEMEKLNDEIKNRQQAFEELEKTQQNAVNAGMTEIAHYQSLYKELQNITDENGKVKDGYEDRATFITTTLSEALGVEINTINGVIQKYIELQGTIDKLIEKKKAKIILDSQENLYKEAIEQEIEALKNLEIAESKVNEETAKRQALQDQYTEAENKYNEAIKKHKASQIDYYATLMNEIRKRMFAQDEELTKARKYYNQQDELLKKYTYNKAQYETNMALFQAEKYNEMTNITWKYQKEYQSASDAQKAALEDQIRLEERKLQTRKEMYWQTGNEIYNNQIIESNNRLSELKQSMKKYNSATETELNKTRVTWSNQLDLQLSEITQSRVEFRNAGGNNVQMYIDGVASGERISRSTMADLVTKTIREISKQETGAEEAGKGLISGFNIGIGNLAMQNSVFGTIGNFAGKLLNKLKSALFEHSPSKATNEMGRFLLQGLKLGIKDEENSVLRQINRFGASVINAFNRELNAGISRNAITGIAHALPTDYKLNNRANLSSNNSSNTYPRYRNTDMIEAFKTALSEMKIELDDEVAGKFVENTVARAIYT